MNMRKYIFIHQNLLPCCNDDLIFFYIKYWGEGRELRFSHIWKQLFVESSLSLGETGSSRSIVNCRGGGPALPGPAGQLRARDRIIRPCHPPLPGQSLQIEKVQPTKQSTQRALCQE